MLWSSASVRVAVARDAVVVEAELWGELARREVAKYRVDRWRLRLLPGGGDDIWVMDELGAPASEPVGEKLWSLRLRHVVDGLSFGGYPLPDCAGGGHALAHDEDLDTGSFVGEVRDAGFVGAVA